jgi:nitroreductase
MDAGRLAPSARNLQDWKFIVVKDKEKRQRLSEAAMGQPYVATAPVVVAIAVDHMSLAAMDEGLGTCWIVAYDGWKS